MQYKDEKGQTYEISYSQKLQKEQNKILRQKNKLIMIMMGLMICFGLAGIYIYIRLDMVNFLTLFYNALQRLMV